MRKTVRGILCGAEPPKERTNIEEFMKNKKRLRMAHSASEAHTGEITCPNHGQCVDCYGWTEGCEEGDRIMNRDAKTGRPAAERQQIVTWYKPEEQLPPDGMYRYVTFSGETKGHIYYHAMGVAKCYHGWADEPPVWIIKGLDILDCFNCTIDAWADLEPFGR
jgi:hypothetical protein